MILALNWDFQTLKFIMIRSKSATIQRKQTFDLIIVTVEKIKCRTTVNKQNKEIVVYFKSTRFRITLYIAGKATWRSFSSIKTQNIAYKAWIYLSKDELLKVKKSSWTHRISIALVLSQYIWILLTQLLVMFQELRNFSFERSNFIKENDEGSSNNPNI